jgi:hypothetical protein
MNSSSVASIGTSLLGHAGQGLGDTLIRDMVLIGA